MEEGAGFVCSAARLVGWALVSPAASVLCGAGRAVTQPSVSPLAYCSLCGPESSSSRSDIGATTDGGMRRAA